MMVEMLYVGLIRTIVPSVSYREEMKFGISSRTKGNFNIGFTDIIGSSGCTRPRGDHGGTGREVVRGVVNESRSENSEERQESLRCARSSETDSTEAGP